jgi:flagellar basal body rod protein FlgC
MKKEPEIAAKGSKGGWLGNKAPEEKPPQAEFKVSAWALKAQEGQGQPVGNFAPLQKTAQEQKLDNVYSRKEQEFKFSSKKEQEERRKVREQQELAIKK